MLTLRAASCFGDEEASSKFCDRDRVGARRIGMEDRIEFRLTTKIAAEMLVVIKMH